MVPLESSKLFGCLTPGEFERVHRAAREQRYAAAEIMFKQGDEGDGIYVVKSGLVQITTLVGQDDRRVFSQVPAGEMFGEMAVMDNDVRSATAIASEETVVYFIPRTDLLEMLELYPRLSVSLVREISRRLRDFNRHYIREVLQAERLALVGRFARSIVHDIKNPLNIIGIAADMAGMNNATVEMRVSARQRIRKQVDRISNMVSELMEFTRGSHTSFVLALTNYDTFINQLFEELKAEAAAKSVTVVMENPPPSARVALNPQRFSRIFFNLVHNSADAMPTGGNVRLRFSTDGKTILTEIEDDGPGIAPEVLDRLFDAFVTHGKAHGTGLGLSICKRIVEDHQGQISARNRPGGGAIFAFTLPIHKS
jgi:signal transduction histidine kinase